MANTDMSADEAWRIYDYDPETGKLHTKGWCGRRKAGAEVIYKNADGYVSVKLRGRRYAAHRVIWLMMTGEWPPVVIDHINEIRDDNRWSNLRLANRSQNGANRKRLTRRNKTGFQGVHKKRDRWQARIMIGDQYKSLGCFETPEQASAAYKEAHAKIHGEFSPFG